MAAKNAKGKTNGANGHGYDACKTSCASKLSVWAVVIAVVWGLCKVADKLNVSARGSGVGAALQPAAGSCCQAAGATVPQLERGQLCAP